MDTVAGEALHAFLQASARAPALQFDHRQAERHALAEVQARHQIQTCQADVVAEHLIAGCQIPDRLEDGRQQRHQVAVGQLAINAHERSAGGAVIVFQHRLDGRIEQLAIDAVQGLGQDALG